MCLYISCFYTVTLPGTDYCDRSYPRVTGSRANPHRSRRDRDSQMIKYCCTFTNTIADVLSARGWKEVGVDQVGQAS